MNRGNQVVIETLSGQQYTHSMGNESIFKIVESKSKNGIALQLKEVANAKKLIENAEKSEFEYYADPPIPEGYSHVSGVWWYDFTIAKNGGGGKFVWVPVCAVTPNGLIQNKFFETSLGRRNFTNIPRTDYNFYNDDLPPEIIDSIEEFGGFYVSKYPISEDNKQRLWSRSSTAPYSETYFNPSVADFYKNSELYAHVIYGAEYDTMLQWFIDSGELTLNDITKETKPFDKKFTPCSSLISAGDPKFLSACGVCGLTGNGYTMTQEYNYITHESVEVVRGCHMDDEGAHWILGYRAILDKEMIYAKSPNCLYRIVLCFK